MPSESYILKITTKVDDAIPLFCLLVVFEMSMTNTAGLKMQYKLGIKKCTSQNLQPHVCNTKYEAPDIRPDIRQMKPDIRSDTEYKKGRISGPTLSSIKGKQ